MVIMPGAGSFMFLGEVLWSLEVSELPEVQDDEYEGDNGRLRSALGKSHCGSCSRCIDYCPTSALVADRVLDARRCISYLTIEKRGSLTHQERTWIGEWVFGCDICQDVCPFNVVSIKSRAKPDCSEFLPSAGVGCSLELSEVIAIRSDAEFVKRFGGTPLMRAKREGLVRNAAVVSANKRVFEVLEGLKSAVREDRSAVVRSHALWAFAQLSSELGSHAVTMLKDLVYLCCVDEDLSVRIEADEISQKLA
jgi:epoxyqueuosine reductase